MDHVGIPTSIWLNLAVLFVAGGYVFLRLGHKPRSDDRHQRPGEKPGAALHR